MFLCMITLCEYYTRYHPAKIHCMLGMIVEMFHPESFVLYAEVFQDVPLYCRLEQLMIFKQVFIHPLIEQA